MEEKINALVNAILENPTFKRYQKLKKEIEKNDEYLILIKNYQDNKSLENKKAIFSKPILKEFYKIENEIDLLLQEINNILKIK